MPPSDKQPSFVPFAPAHPVGDWLKEHGFEECVEAFDENGVDADLISALTNEDLRDLGILRVADRKRLLQSIAELTEDNKQGISSRSPPAASKGRLRQGTVAYGDMAEWIDATKTRAYFGGVSDMWLSRRLKDDPSFPRPISDVPPDVPRTPTTSHAVFMIGEPDMPPTMPSTAFSIHRQPRTPE